MEKNDKEIMELKHEPVPGYRTFFYIIFTMAVIYLAVIFYNSL